MKTFISILFIISTLVAYAQEKTPQEKFNKDRESNNITLYILGGIVPKTKTQNDLDFQAKYKVKYYDFGCLAPVNMSFYEDYNLLALNYLADKYGKEEIKDIRRDILGFEKWNKK